VAKTLLLIDMCYFLFRQVSHTLRAAAARDSLRIDIR
jgi:hypothetical protein